MCPTNCSLLNKGNLGQLNRRGKTHSSGYNGCMIKRTRKFLFQLIENALIGFYCIKGKKTIVLLTLVIFSLIVFTDCTTSFGEHDPDQPCLCISKEWSKDLECILERPKPRIVIIPTSPPTTILTTVPTPTIGKGI